MFRLAILAVLATLAWVTVLNGQTTIPQNGNVTLAARYVDKQTGDDNYVNAAYSFEKAVNGFAGLRQTRNDWDLLFSTIRNSDGTVWRNVFDVTMVVDDRSRIVDLGDHKWSDPLELPELPAFEKPERERSVEALLGHIYLVHTADTDSDLYTMFRVEELRSGDWVKISWKRITSRADK